MEKSILEGERLASAFRGWAKLGRTLLALRSGRQVTWKSVDRMTSAAKAPQHEQLVELRGLLLGSNSRLAPLTEPLLSNFDLHRWLAEEREEIYSDWLEWVIKQLPTVGDVLDVLDMPRPEGMTSDTPIAFSTKREKFVELPHWETFKKLDLVIHSPGRVLVLIEVKKTSAEQADVAKQRAYAEWAEAQPERNKYLVLLAKESERPEYHKFQLRTYGGLCRALREKVRGLVQNRHMPIATGALVLAFVGAVEQNLLGLSSVVARRVVEGEEVSTARGFTDYLEHFLGGRLGK